MPRVQNKTHQSGNVCSSDIWTTDVPTQQQEVTADNTILAWQPWCQVYVCPIHAAQALLLDGAPVAEVRAMNSFSRTVWRTSQDGFQFQIHHLTAAMQKHNC